MIVDNTYNELENFKTNVLALNNKGTMNLIREILSTFEWSKKDFLLHLNFSQCQNFARITIRATEKDTGAILIVEHDRYTNGENKSKTCWIDNQKWLTENKNKSITEKSVLSFCKTSFGKVKSFCG